MRPPRILVASLLVAATSTLAAPSILDALVAARFGTAAHVQQDIALPAGAPSEFSVTVSHAGAPVTLLLRARSLRAPTFTLRAWAAGSTSVVEAPPASTYQGIIAGEPGSAVGGTLSAAGLSVRVFPASGDSWAIRPLRLVEPGAPRERHLVLEGGDWPQARNCGVGEGALPPEEPEPGNSGAATLPVPHSMRERTGLPDLPRDRAPSWCGSSGMKLAQIAFDVDQVYFRDHGSDTAAVTLNVEGLLAEVDAFYARDALITYELTDIIVRTTDFYLPDATTGSLLDLFRAEWNANQTAVVRDIAHLMTGQPAPGLAGLAYVGVTCNLAWCYGWSVDSAGVLGHELGHNWSAGHCHDTTPCNNMCGACLSIGPITQDIIMGFRDSRTCLDDVAPYAASVPPYADPDRVTLSRAEFLAGASVPVDVLANDHDANCDDLRIASFDATTQQGGSVALDLGGGPAGRDRLLYTPPCHAFSGMDAFAYSVEDLSGASATTIVSVDLADPGLVAFWPLDEAAGTSAADATGWQRDGTLQGSATWVPGRVGGALALDGIDQHVTVPRLDLPGRSVTISCWVQRVGAMNPFTGLVFCRGGSTTAGLHVGDTADLRYTWTNDAATYGWNSGLVLPDGRWAFAALVVEPGQATMYMDDGTWQRATNVLAHGVQAFDADTSLGRDPTGGGRYLGGLIDDVRIHDGALTEADLQAIRDGAGRAEAPRPPDGGMTADPDVVLSWRPAPGATAHDVYFGTDLATVRDATPADPEYLGRFATPSMNPPGLLTEGATQAWRVDEVTPGGIVRGEPWIFTFRGRTPRELAYFRLDDAPGTSASDATGTGHDGVLDPGASWTTGPHRGAVSLAGGVVRVPALDVTGTEMTIMARLRTTGTPASWAGIVFSRAAGTTAGLNFRDTAELGYHWNGAGNTWGWSSGLVVPADTWVFVALAIRPDRATIWLDEGSGLRSATNAVGHASQSFAGELLLGGDAWGAARRLQGDLDDVRIIDRALTDVEVAAIRDEPAKAWNPEPADGQLRRSAPTRFAWVPGADTDAHDLYVGDDFAAVLAADPTSPEFRGTLAPASWTSSLQPAPGTTTYWRVDEHVGGRVVIGDVWRFALVPDVGDALRVVKSPGGEPRLQWPRVPGALSCDVARCLPSPGGSCAPATIVSLPGTATSHDDADVAGERLAWYSVTATPCE